VLQEQHLVNDTVGGILVLVLWVDGTTSALDRELIARGRDVGTALAYQRRLDPRLLSFQLDDDDLIDAETGSRWNVLGRAESGPLEGSELVPVVAINHFWFSWAAFRPDTRIFREPLQDSEDPPEVP